MKRKGKGKRESKEAPAAFGGAGVELEEAIRRCRVVRDRVESLSSSLSSPSAAATSCKRTLLRLVDAELSFLSRFSLSSSSSSSSSWPNPPNPNLNSNPALSINIGHLEAVIHILQLPFITGVSRLCKPIPLSSSVQNGHTTTTSSKGVHVDIVCSLNGNPVWFIVSDRNPKYVSWDGHGSCRNKGLRMRVEQVLDAASSSVTLKPSSIILFFSNGLDDFVRKKLQDEFGATNFEMEFSDFDCGFSEELEGEWIDILAKSYQQASILEIKIDCSWTAISSRMACGVKAWLLDASRQQLSGEYIDLNFSGSFRSLISRMELCSLDVIDMEFGLTENLSSKAGLVNFDTTALIAIVSGISNGNTEKLLAAPENELRSQFKSNFEFVIGQVMSEIQNPIHIELGCVISGKRGIICESVCSEFEKLVSMCGGPNESLRANHLLDHLMVVPDCPSVRIMSLQTTRKMALKNKVVFGTGDYWHAPTLTANMAFVRAISQTGMSLFTIEHRARALIGD